MKVIFFLAFWVAAVFAIDAKSGRLHGMEKVMFYRYYQLEELFGETDRKFAPDCKNCDFNKFIEHVINNGREVSGLGEPSYDQKSLRKEINAMFTNSKTKTIAGAQFDNLRIMPSIGEDTPLKYDVLYQKTAEWTTDAKAKIENLEGEKREKAQKLWDNSKIAMQDMKNMRKAGFLNSQLQEAKADPNLGGKMSQYEKKIPPELNGGVSGYKEIDWAKLRKSSKDAALLSTLETWVQTRATSDTITRQHIAADDLVEGLQRCYT